MKSTSCRVWDVWEICPSPCGEGGLKSGGDHTMGGVPQMSLPVRGGWIEIVDGKTVNGKSASPSPCGEGGLKSLRATFSRSRIVVPPRAGRVD